jgi:hypothetical protein
MPSQPSSGISHSLSRRRREPTLTVAYWLLGIATAVELVFAAIGLAPRLAGNLRNSGSSQPPPAMQQSSSPSTTTLSGMQTALLNGSAGQQPKSEDSTAMPPAALVAASSSIQQSYNGDSSSAPALGILTCRVESSGSGTKHLQIAIKARPGGAIDVSQVKVQVYFYDYQNGEIVPSRAQVTSRWLSAPVDWSKPELLEVNYLSDTTDQDTRFAGYLVAIYYKGDLQDCRADPPKLKKLFEPKYFIGPDEQ